MVISMQFKDEMLNYESSNYNTPYIIKIGLLPVILTAPHTIKQLKENGTIKLPEPFTKAIAMYIANKLDTSFLIKTQDTGVDANSDNKEDFKETLLQIIKSQNIKLLIDIHGSKKERDFDIEFGTLNNLSADYSTVKELEDSFKEHNIYNIVYNEPFKGGGITKYIYGNTDIDVIQIEINQKFRDIDNIDNLKNVCDSLITFIKQYTKD